MARRFTRIFGVLAITLLLCFKSVPFAQQSTGTAGSNGAVPRFITFGGVIRDGNGQLLQGVVGVTFAMYQSQNGGAPLWTENQNIQFDSEGRYTVLLGATQPSGLPMDLFTSGQSRWLGVQAQLPGEVEQPRVLLVSVPYALKAADADTIGGMPLSAFLLADPGNAPASFGGTVGSAATNITRAGVSPRFTGAGSGTSTPNLTVKWTDANGTLGNGSIQDNGTGVALAVSSSNNLGIGTTSPISRLHMVDQNGGFFVDASSAAGGDVNMGLYNTVSGRQFTLRNMAASGSFVLRDDTAAASRLTVANNGNVGIGTTSPISRLHMVDQNGGFFVDASAAAGGDVNFGLYNTVSNRQYTFRAMGASGSFILRDDSAAAARLTIDSSGNMGVGTTTPAAKLDVAGDLKVEGNIVGGLNLNGGVLNLNSGNPLQINGTPFLSNFGTQNTFVGTNAGNGSMTGGENTAQGYQALLNNTSGNQNTASGSLALQNNTSGSNNTVLGYSAGVTNNAANANTTGSNNTFLGFQAGPGTSTQLNNATAIGANAVVAANNTLVLGAPGVSVAIGAATASYKLDVQGGQINASGGLCINGVCQTSWPSGGGSGSITGVTAGTGLSGGGSNGTVTLNIANGGIGTAQIASGAITDASVSASAAIAPTKIAGTAATLGANTYGGSQTISNGALNLPTTTNSGSGILSLGGTAFLHDFGTQNTFVGSSAGNTSMTGGENTAHGYQGLSSNTTGSSNTATGATALSQNTTGSNNTALGYAAGVTGTAANANTTGTNNTFIGSQSGPGTATQLSNATAIGANAVVSANNTLVLGAQGVSVAIGATTAGYKLDVQGGQINATGGLCISGVCQTSWPAGGIGTITGVTAGTGLSGGGNTGAITLNIANGGIGSAQIASGAISDANVNASAAIAPTKIAGTAATLGTNTFSGSQTISNGSLNLPTTTNTGSGILSLGGTAFLHDFGTQNTFVGSSAGNTSMTGGENTAHGYQGLSSNTSGNSNTATGATALSHNTTGSNNTALGYAAGVTSTSANSNTTGSNNTFIGSQSGPGTATQLSNATAIGANAVVSANNTLVLGAPGVSVAIGASTAGYSLDVQGGQINAAGGLCINGVCQTTWPYTSTADTANTALGSSAFQSNTTGTSNTATGYSALLSNTSGNDNTAIGTMALNSNISGSDNSGNGNFALSTNTNGNNNTAGGSFALYANTTGNDNTASGYGALGGNTTGNFNTANGSNALISNTIGNENSGNGYSVLYNNTSGIQNTASGTWALYSNTTGNFNTAVGWQAGLTANFANANVTGSSNTFLGFGTGPGTPTQLNNATAIGANAVVSASNTMVLGAPGVSVVVGAATAATTFQVVGDIRVGNGGTNGCIQGFDGHPIAGTCSSDLRLKQNIEPFAAMLDKVSQLQPVTYEYRTEEHPEYNFGTERAAGLIAQDVEKLFPDMVATDERGYKAVNYSQLPLLLLQALRELKADNDALKQEVEQLKSRLQAPGNVSPAR